ncbi:MAG: Holliday junction resolvase RuvX [Phycisphaerales bacterium]
MRYLAVDLGQKRTGLAVGDDITRLVQPYEVVTAPLGPRLFEALARAIDDIGPDVVVVGLPANMDGTEGPAAAAVRSFGAELARLNRVRVEFQDERLTSFAAEQRLHRSGRTRQEKKELRDALAAAEILRDYLGRGTANDDKGDDDGDDPGTDGDANDDRS